MYLAVLDAEKGQSDAADTLAQLIAYAEAKGYIWDILDGRYLLATLAFRRHDEQTARRELLAVRDLAVETHNQLLGQWASEMLEQLASWTS
jgi:predicted transcriptional regulator of viral defense system